MALRTPVPNNGRGVLSALFYRPGFWRPEKGKRLPATAERYSATRTAEGLLVRDVVVAVTGETGRGFALTEQDFANFQKTFDDRTKRGHIGAYVRLEHDGPRVGKWIAMRQSSGELRGDLLIETAFDEGGKVAALIERDSITDLSITFSREHGVLTNVSLIAASFGQLHAKLPPFKVDVQSEFGVPPGALIELAFKADEELNMKPEDFQKMLDATVKPLAEKLEKFEARIDGKDKGGKSASLTGDPEVEDAARRLVKDELDEFEKRKDELELDSMLTRLESMAGGTTATQRKNWRERLAERKQGQREDRFNLMVAELERKKAGTPLKAETPFIQNSVEAQLREEFKSFELPADNKFSVEDYVKTYRNEARDLR